MKDVTYIILTLGVAYANLLLGLGTLWCVTNLFHIHHPVIIFMYFGVFFNSILFGFIGYKVANVIVKKYKFNVSNHDSKLS